MNKLVKRLLTGTLALATILTALPVTAVHASGNQYWMESAERVGYIEQIMNDGSIKSTFHNLYSDVQRADDVVVVLPAKAGENTFLAGAESKTYQSCCGYSGKCKLSWCRCGLVCKGR